jgi:putative ABC transport system permease protein
MQAMNAMSSTSNIGISSYPESISENDNYLKDNYELLAGEYPNSETDVVLIVDSKNQIEKATLEQLGYDVKHDETIAFDQVVGTEFKVVSNNDYYTSTDLGYYVPSKDYETMYQSEDGFTLRISGVIRAKEGSSMSLLSPGIAYSDKLSQRIIEDATDSDIVKSQKESDNNVMTGEKLDEETKSLLLAYLGGDPSPYMIMMYPRNFEAKEQVTQYIEDYNAGKTEEEAITYTDLAGTISEMTKDIMDGITVVLIAFAAISLVVSMIMISIITYTSVLERTKEIGILKALGARKKDITRVFDAETIILGVFSGVLGVTIAWLLTFPINALIKNMTGLTNASHLQINHAVLLVFISTIITVLGGHIPAKMASKKDVVEALRSE